MKYKQFRSEIDNIREKIDLADSIATIKETSKKITVENAHGDVNMSIIEIEFGEETWRKPIKYHITIVHDLAAYSVKCDNRLFEFYIYKGGAFGMDRIMTDAEIEEFIEALIQLCKNEYYKVLVEIAGLQLEMK